jgi:O-methyltransferase
MFQNDNIKSGPEQTQHQNRPNPIHLWEENREFCLLFNKIAQNTLVDKPRCFMLYQFANHTSSLKGDVAEIGVYKGGTAKLLANVFSKKSVHIFDTFEGMPPADPAKDIHKEGDFREATLDIAKSFFADDKNIRIHKGLFPQTGKAIEQKTFCFVHIDVDIYRSVIDCCQFFFEKMEIGGIMVFDDYGFLSCPGAKAAVDEFFIDKKEYPCYLPTGQAFVIKF